MMLKPSRAVSVQRLDGNSMTAILSFAMEERQYINVMVVIRVICMVEVCVCV